MTPWPSLIRLIMGYEADDRPRQASCYVTTEPALHPLHSCTTSALEQCCCCRVAAVAAADLLWSAAAIHVTCGMMMGNAGIGWVDMSHDGDECMGWVSNTAHSNALNCTQPRALAVVCATLARARARARGCCPSHSCSLSLGWPSSKSSHERMHMPMHRICPCHDHEATPHQDAHPAQLSAAACAVQPSSLACGFDDMHVCACVLA